MRRARAAVLSIAGLYSLGRLDHAGQQGGLPRLQLLDAELVTGRAAAFVLGLMAEVGLGGGLDPVGAAAEVDRVQVGGDDLVLGPLVGELVGEGGLAELLEDRAVGLGLEGVLDELLLDRGGALDAALAADVGEQGAGDPAQVDAAVVVEALVLDRHHRLLDDRGDLAGVRITRFCWLRTPIGWPRSSYRNELCSLRYSEKRVSEGRSATIETNTPNTNDTRPAAAATSRSRSGAGASAAAGR